MAKITEKRTPTVNKDLLGKVQFVPGAPGQAVPLHYASDGTQNSETVQHLGELVNLKI